MKYDSDMIRIPWFHDMFANTGEHLVYRGRQIGAIGARLVFFKKSIKYPGGGGTEGQT